MTDTRVHLANKHGDANDNQVYVFATSLESLKRKVDVCWEKTEVGICLTVQDTGIGCAPDVVNQIFEPFVVEDGRWDVFESLRLKMGPQKSFDPRFPVRILQSPESEKELD